MRPIRLTSMKQEGEDVVFLSCPGMVTIVSANNRLSLHHEHARLGLSPRGSLGPWFLLKLIQPPMNFTMSRLLEDESSETMMELPHET